MSPYTAKSMVTDDRSERRRVRFEALYAEAKQTLGYAANQLRALTERAREVHSESPTAGEPGGPEREDPTREAVEQARLELVVRGLEQSWLFLERGSADPADPKADIEDLEPELRMHILEAQEAERARLAQEMHDGPAHAFANAVFRVDIIERALDQDPAAARQELAGLRELLHRELVEMRSFMHQMRPPLLDRLGLDGAIRDAVALLPESGVAGVEVDLAAPADLLSEQQQTVALRIVQEALRNIRRHAGARHVRVATWLERSDGETAPRRWILRVDDDGRGFDVPGTLEDDRRRRFGLHFMRDRAAAVGAALDIESGPATGTSVRLTMSAAEGR